MVELFVWSAFYVHPLPSGRYSTTPCTMFGEFVTATQAGTIRGCMGWWSPDCAPVDPKTVSQQFSGSLVQASLYDDPRSHPFRGKDFFSDSSAHLHLQVLCLPIRPVRPRFSNARRGILLVEVNGGGRRATFLPGVFPGLSLPDIVPRLVQKAGSPEDYRLFSYTTAGIEWPVTKTFLRSRVFLRTLGNVIADAVRCLVGSHRGFPYRLPVRARQWCEDDTQQHVRNLACLGLLRRYDGRDHPRASGYRERIDPKEPHALVYLRPAHVRYEDLDDVFGKPQYLLKIGNGTTPTKYPTDRSFMVVIPWSVIETSLLSQYGLRPGSVRYSLSEREDTQSPSSVPQAQPIQDQLVMPATQAHAACVL